MAAERGAWWGHQRTLVLFAIMGGILYEMHRRELEQSRQEQQARQDAQTVREAAAISAAATQGFGPGDVAFELLQHP